METKKILPKFLNTKIYLKIFKFKVNSYLAMTSLSLVIKKIFTNEGNSGFEKN